MQTMSSTARSEDSTGTTGTLYMAIELSLAKWKLCFSNGGDNPRLVATPARDYPALMKEVDKAKKKFGLPHAQVVSCYEAGREGFSVHRSLLARGIDNYVVDSASIKVERQARQRKTDTLDAQQLVKQLVVHFRAGGDKLHVVAVPTEDQEDLRQHTRELYRLRADRTAMHNEIRGLLFTQGHDVQMRTERDLAQLELALVENQLNLGPHLRDRLLRRLGVLAVLAKQLGELARHRKELLQRAETSAMQQVRTLMMLCGIGIESAWTLVLEVFNWRQFPNRRNLASFLGLVPVPYASGKMARDLGISKAGSARLRALLIELAWLWLRYQPNSELTLWFHSRFGSNGGRSRRIGIVALARKLVILLWRFHRSGEQPRGAELRDDPFVSPRRKRRLTSAEPVIANAAA